MGSVTSCQLFFLSIIKTLSLAVIRSQHPLWFGCEYVKEAFMVHAGSTVIVIYTSFMYLLGCFHVFMGPNDA